MNFLQLQNQMYTRLSLGSTSAFYKNKTSTLSYIKEIINLAKSWAEGLYDWKFMERAVYTTTSNSAEWYDYPTLPYIFKTDGIIRVEIDTSTTTTPYFEKHNKQRMQYLLDFKLDMQDDASNMQDVYYFADYNRQIHLYPTPADGKTMKIWGIIKPADLVDDTDVTIFGDHEPDADEAILKKALSTALAKAGQKQLGQAEETEAVNILQRIDDRYRKRQGVSRAENPFWRVPDYFADTNIRSFDNNNEVS